MIIEYILESNRYMSLIGIVVVLTVAFLFSSHRSKVSMRVVLGGLFLQFSLAFFILRTARGHELFATLERLFNSLYSFAGQGGQFLFGNLTDPTQAWGFVFAVKLIPMIIFFGALMALLFHLGIVQVVVKAVSWVVRPLLGTSGAETLCATANSMLGQTEAPLLVKHYLKNMTRSELLVVMVSGMSTLSGSILAVYGSMGVPMIHLLAASVMAIPGSMVIAKILIPETEKPETMGDNHIAVKHETSNILDALSRGTTDGVSLAVNVAAMLIAFISLMALVNTGLQYVSGYSLDQLFAKLFSVVAYILGVSWQDSKVAGMLLGKKLVINEFIAYAQFVTTDMMARSKIILTYALAGFANFSCIGIQIGGIGALAPEKRQELTRLGLTALLGGTLTNFLNAAIAGLFV